MEQQDLDFFIEHGYLHLKNCFDAGPGTIVERWRNEHWQRYEVDPDDPDSWPAIKRIPANDSVLVKEFAPKAYEAICAVMGGVDQLLNPDFRWDNSFLMNYCSGYQDPFVPANCEDIPSSNWHCDGSWFRHFLDSPEQGILGIVMWSDMKVGQGNTVVALDSVGPIAKHLAEHPEGLGPGEFPWKTIIHNCSEIIDLTGNAGDVVLVHPFTMHRGSQNIKRIPRFMTNIVTSFKEPMNFNRPDKNYTPMELMVLNALDTDHIDFKATGERMHIDNMQAYNEQYGKRVFDDPQYIS